jgi:hypothetical protein
MFPVLAILCFLLVVFGAAVGIDLMALGLAFVAAALLVGDWPLGGRLRR